MVPRVFLTLPIDQKIIDELTFVQNELRAFNRRVHIRWTDKSHMHLTLAFLGDLTDEQADQVKSAMDDLSSTQSFSLWLDHLDAFPDKSEPRIITVRTGEEHHDAEHLHNAMSEQLKADGILPDQKPWKPHITIGRNRSGEHVDGFQTVDVEKAVWKVDRIGMYSSVLTGRGPIYTKLYEVKLAE